MNNRSRFILFTLVIVTTFLVGGLLIDQNHRTTASDQPSTGINLGVEQSENLVIRIYYDSQDQLNAVAGELDIWEVHPIPGLGPSSGYIVAAVIPAQRDWLVSLGYRTEVDAEKTAQLQAPLAALDPRYYYFDNYFNNSNNRYVVNFLEDTSTAFPQITELLDVGDAWLASHGGYARDMWVLRISNEDPQYGDISSKPTFFMFANIHAREVTTPELAIRYIKYFTSGYLGQGGYGTDPDVTWLVNHHAVYIMVTINPDGKVVDEQNTSAYWRKNVDNLNGCNDPSSWGTDINRNSSFRWGCCGGSSGNPCNDTYRGPSRASEPETEAFQDFAATIFLDQNGNNGDDEIVPSPDDASGIFITLHSYADDVLWPFGFGNQYAPNNAQLTTIGRKLADITVVMQPAGNIDYTVDGSSDDWIYGKLGIAAFTYEVGPNYGDCSGFFPSYDCQDGINGASRNFWNEMRLSLVYANKIAATPYITSYGPDAQDLAVNPSSVPGGVPVDLTGTVLDQRYSGDPLVPIAAAEYFIDAPGTDGTGFALAPTDGSFGETSEDVYATVDTSGLTEGQHYILVHGKNQNGVWGPFTAVFLNITTPSYGVMLTPETDAAQADPGMTVTYHMTVNNIGLNNDSYNISVTSSWAYSAPTTIGPISAGSNGTFDVQVTVPVDANDGESDVATVTVTSQFNPVVNDSSSLMTTANLYQLSLTPPAVEANGYPGNPVNYTLHLTNEGNALDSFDLQSNATWPVDLPGSAGPLEPGIGVDIVIVVHVPPTAEPGEFDVATITATSEGDSAKSASSTLTTTAVQAGPFVEPANAEGIGDPGTQVTYLLQLTNRNMVEDTFTVSANSGWAIEYPSSVGPLPPDGSTEITVKVTIPADVDGGTFDMAVLTFASSDPLLPHATATLKTIAKSIYSFQAVPLVDTLTGHGKGVSVQYTILITNTGNAADTYNINVMPGGWPVSAPATVGPVGRGESTSVTISIQVPFDIVMGDTNEATLIFTSQGNGYGFQVFLYTNTFWYSNLMPLSQKS